MIPDLIGFIQLMIERCFDSQFLRLSMGAWSVPKLVLKVIYSAIKNDSTARACVNQQTCRNLIGLLEQDENRPIVAMILSKV